LLAGRDGLHAPVGRDTDQVVSVVESCDHRIVGRVGVLLLLAGWATLDAATWRRRSALAVPRSVLVLTILAGIGAAAVVVWSVGGDHGVWWIAGATVLAAIQLVAAARVS
jgi:hypothetical protein